MRNILMLLYILLIGLDLINLIDLRWLIYSFLLSKRNLKGAKKIHNMQSKKARFSLAYIKEYTIYPKAFRFFYGFRLINLFLLVPQYITIVILNLFSVFATIILIGIFVIAKIFIAIFIRSQFSSNRISRFDKRY